MGWEISHSLENKPDIKPLAEDDPEFQRACSALITPHYYVVNAKRKIIAVVREQNIFSQICEGSDQKPSPETIQLSRENGRFLEPTSALCPGKCQSYVELDGDRFVVIPFEQTASVRRPVRRFSRFRKQARR